MHRPAVFIRRAVLRFAGTTSVRCRLLSSIPVLSPKQPHRTRPTPPLYLSSQTLLRAVSSSSSSSSSSSGPATASLSTVTADSTATRNEKDKDTVVGAGAGADADAYSSSSVIYVGPLTQTFRRLKIFSLSSLALASSLTPLIFIVESSLPSTARAALATTALATSGVSTALVAWCGRPYVTTLRNLATTTTVATSSPPSPSNSTSEAQEQTVAHSHSHNENVPAGIEMTTLTLTLSPLTTRVYDPAFLCDTTRAFARWELARSVQLPPEDAVGVRPGSEETVAETMDGAGNVSGRWIVTWGENGEGSCRAEGRIET
ncbi:hypothetical protein F5888DRAFT_1657907 [Russula emetica]|nr:hypothetical protein F5888DRAFT_1657907 [Russula emetica]